MGSDTYSPYREIDLPARPLFTPARIIDQRELDRLAERRYGPSRVGPAGWRPVVIQGGKAVEPGEVRRSTGLPATVIRTTVRIGLVAVIVAGLLVMLVMPRATADRGPAPAVSHVVQSGDTLWSVAKAYTPDTGDVRATVALIRAANPSSSGLLVVGDVIEVPVGDIPGRRSGASGY